MKQDMEQLIKCLNTQNYLYHEMLELSEKKRRAVVENDIDTLNFIVEQEKGIVEKLSAIEGLRIKCSERIGKQLGIEKNITLRQIIDKAEDTADVLSTLLKDLSETISSLKKLNGINSNLINMQLGYIENLKNAYFAADSSYGSDGKDKKEKTQSVNLFDRTV
ncbi:MAG: flagellar protein FlgN [Clostridia bacterium]|nr:flagellar protein FlgN [Clostridia bacterium]